MNIEYFNDLLDMIKNKELHDITTRYLAIVPEYFWIVSSSLSGKHHPPDEGGNEGLLLHTRRVVIFSIQAARASDVDQDPYIVAGICHDTYKYGPGPNTDRDGFPVHGELACSAMMSISGTVSGATRKQWLKACSLVLTHNGRWGNIPPRDSEELSFHLADLYAANIQLS